MTSRTPSDIAGDQIKEWRRRRDMTAEDLAARCADLGGPEITAAVIANIETGRRDRATKRRRRVLTLEEMCLFAEALDVPPVTLLVPLDGRTDLEVTPNATRSSYSALFWVTGESEPGDRERRARWREAAGPVDTYRTFRDTFRAAAKAEAREDLATRDAHLRTLAQVVELGMLNRAITPPALPAEWLDVMRDKGWLERADEVPVQAEDD